MPLASDDVLIVPVPCFAIHVLAKALSRYADRARGVGRDNGEVMASIAYTHGRVA